jgi:hypothetical protein
MWRSPEAQIHSWLSNSRIQLSVSDSSAIPSAAASYGHAGDRVDAAPATARAVTQPGRRWLRMRQMDNQEVIRYSLAYPSSNASLTVTLKVAMASRVLVADVKPTVANVCGSQLLAN